MYNWYPIRILKSTWVQICLWHLRFYPHVWCWSCSINSSLLFSPALPIEWTACIWLASKVWANLCFAAEYWSVFGQWRSLQYPWGFGSTSAFGLLRYNHRQLPVLRLAVQVWPIGVSSECCLILSVRRFRQSLRWGGSDGWRRIDRRRGLISIIAHSAPSFFGESAQLQNDSRCNRSCRR